MNTTDRRSVLGRFTAALVIPASAWLAHPGIGAAVIAVGAAGVSVLLGTALFGSDRHSARAFRVLRWLSGRPEPRQHGTQPRDDSGR